MEATDLAEPTESAAANAYSAILMMITDGRLASGERLREEALADTLGVSRTPVREALRRLSAEGLLEITRNRGARVLGWTQEDIDEIFELRILLEGYGARVAAQHVDADSIARLRSIQDRFESAVSDGSRGHLDCAMELNNEFHAVILGSTGNHRLIGLLRGIISVPLVRRTFAHYSHQDLERSVNHHREIIDAMVRRDSTWAELTMRAHIHAARHVVNLPRE